MNDDQLLRYSRHILLPEIGIEGQARILAAHALIVGVGGLGSPPSSWFCAIGSLFYRLFCLCGDWFSKA